MPLPDWPLDADDVVADEPVVGRARTRRRRPIEARRPRSESSVQKGCIARLRLLGYGVVTTGSRYLPTGTPDILACVRGRFLAVEVKRPGGDPPTPAQLGQLRRWQEAGALVGWVTSEDQLEELLAKAGDVDWRNDLASPGAGPTVGGKGR